MGWCVVCVHTAFCDLCVCQEWGEVGKVFVVLAQSKETENRNELGMAINFLGTNKKKFGLGASECGVWNRFDDDGTEIPSESINPFNGNETNQPDGFVHDGHSKAIFRNIDALNLFAPICKFSINEFALTHWANNINAGIVICLA